jgi:hypothetical protein
MSHNRRKLQKRTEDWPLLPSRQALAPKALDQPDRASKQSPEKFLNFSAGPDGSLAVSGCKRPQIPKWNNYTFGRGGPQACKQMSNVEGQMSKEIRMSKPE